MACGTPLGAGSAAESRRVVSILFCGMGIDRVGERSDGEALRAVMHRYFGKTRTIVERHEGAREVRRRCRGRRVRRAGTSRG